MFCEIWWHITAITYQIFMLTYQIFVSSCQIFKSARRFNQIDPKGWT